MWGVLPLLLAVVAALLGPTDSAFAAVSAPTAKPKAAATSTATRTAAARTPKAAKPKPVTKPVTPTRSRIPAAPKDLAALRAAAVTGAITRSTVPSTCSGALTADTIYPCTTPTGTETYTLTLTRASDLLVVRALSAEGGSPTVTVTAPDNSTVTCLQPYWFQPSHCPTTQAGTYTVQVQDGGGAFTLDWTALFSDASCAAADPSFSSASIHGSLAAGATGACYTLAMKSGEVLHFGVSATPWQALSLVVFDATGAQVCISTAGDCTLTGTAPYRVLAADQYAGADTYDFVLRDLTQPQGCLAVAQQTYGTTPDAGSTVACRTLTVTTAGLYQVYAASGISGGISGSLYHPDGTVACTNSGPMCQLDPGSYDFVEAEYPPTVPAFALVFIAATETRGCTATGDTDFATGAAKGSFSGIGEEICLTLPTAAGTTDYMFDQPTADGSSPSMQVLDATGAQQCAGANYEWATCALTGTAPFHALLSAQAATGAYQLLVQRSDSSAGCAVWPASPFGGALTVSVPLTAGANVHCLSIPANSHSTGEMIDYTNNANQVNGNITVNDPTGKQVCIGTTTAVCSYKTGVAYTALVEGVDVTASDTYRVVRRDVSRTAGCATPASTTVGGPSTGFVLSSSLDAQCVRVTASATDRIWADARTSVPAPAGAVLEVADANGTIVCRQWGVSCRVSGSTSYQVIVIASDYSGIAIPARVDTWRVGTDAGWAPQCTAHPLSANGFAPQSGSLSETSTAYCAVVQLPTNEMFGYAIATRPGGGTPNVAMFDSTNWTNGFGLCGYSGAGLQTFAFECETQAATPGQSVVLVTPGSTPTPTGYTMQGICAQGCATPPTLPTPTSVSPSSGPAESQNQVVVSGTGLSLATPLVLARNGSVVSSLTPQSVNAAGTSLTAVVHTTGVAPGGYDVALSYVGYSTGTPSPGYLPGAYTVTAAQTPTDSRFVPVTPQRILDTRAGLGAPKARVGAHQTVKLKVTGVAGVPTSGVTAVVMNVTEVQPTAAGFISVYPDGKSLPNVSNLNFTTGQTIPNLVVVPVTDGKVDLYNGSGGAVDLLADITGYDTGTGSVYRSVGPVRALDTRYGIGGTGAAVVPGGAAGLSVTDVPGANIPGTVTAVVLNVTVTGPVSGGFLTVFPDGQSLPNVSNLNFMTGQTISNLVVVPVVDGRVDFFNHSGGTVQVIADLAGYYTT